jgi:hypothetical protein
VTLPSERLLWRAGDRRAGDRRTGDMFSLWAAMLDIVCVEEAEAVGVRMMRGEERLGEEGEESGVFEAVSTRATEASRVRGSITAHRRRSPSS